MSRAVANIADEEAQWTGHGDSTTEGRSVLTSSHSNNGFASARQDIAAGNNYTKTSDRDSAAEPSRAFSSESAEPKDGDEGKAVDSEAGVPRNLEPELKPTLHDGQMPRIYERISGINFTFASFFPRNGTRRRIQLKDLANCMDDSANGVLFVENPSTEWIIALGNTLNIDTAFFVDHLEATYNKNERQQRLGVRIKLSTPSSKAWNDSMKISEFSRIASGYRLRESLYLFVYDDFYWRIHKPITIMFDNLTSGDTNESSRRLRAHVRQSSWTPHSQRRVSHGVVDNLIRIFLEDFHGFNSLASVDWTDGSSRGATELSMLLALAIWKTNLQAVDLETRMIAYEQMMAPTTATFHQLAHLRRIVLDTRDDFEILGTKGLEKNAKAYDERVRERRNVPAIADEVTDLITMHKTLDDVQSLLKRTISDLDNTTQLLIGVTTVMDSAFMKTQSDRATTLTILAAIYLPLSLVTGIFGMNIKEINGGPLPWWVSLATLAVIAVSTAVFYVVYIFLRSRWRTLVEEEQRRDDNGRGPHTSVWPDIIMMLLWPWNKYHYRKKQKEKVLYRSMVQR